RRFPVDAAALHSGGSGNTERTIARVARDPERSLKRRPSDPPHRRWNFTANWITRVATPCTPPPTVPKLADNTLRSTLAGEGLKRLKTLKISTRNSMLPGSGRLNALVSETSALMVPGKRMAPVRGELPKLPNCAGTKAEVSNQRWNVRSLRGKLTVSRIKRSGREGTPVAVVSSP